MPLASALHDKAKQQALMLSSDERGRIHLRTLGHWARLASGGDSWAVRRHCSLGLLAPPPAAGAVTVWTCPRRRSDRPSPLFPPLWPSSDMLNGRRARSTLHLGLQPKQNNPAPCGTLIFKALSSSALFHVHSNLCGFARAASSKHHGLGSWTTEMIVSRCRRVEA